MAIKKGDLVRIVDFKNIRREDIPRDPEVIYKVVKGGKWDCYIVNSELSISTYISPKSLVKVSGKIHKIKDKYIKEVKNANQNNSEE